MSRHTMVCVLAVAAAALLATAAPAARNPLPRAGATAASAIASWAGEQSYPRATWHANGGTHLVVFEDHLDLDGGYNICGVRIDDNGTPWPGSITIADDGHHRTRPDLDGGTMAAGMGFLVVYQYLYSANDQDVYARFVRTHGDMPGPEIPIATTGYWDCQPAVAYGGTDPREFLVVWSMRYSLETESDVWGVVVSPDGVPGAPVQITSDAGREEQPAVAYDGATGGWLVAWSANGDIRGRRLGPDGDPPGAAFDIAAGPGVQTGPRLRQSAESPQIVMVYQDDLAESTGPFRVRAVVIIPEGVTIGPVIANQLSRDVAGPDLAYSQPLQGWVTIWEQSYSSTDHDVYAQLIRSDLVPREPARPISLGTAMEVRPALSAGSPLKVLAAWEDYRNAGLSADVYGEMLPLGCLSGHVYRGPVGDARVPFEGVSVELWGSALSGSRDLLLGRFTTWANGWFTLGFFNPPSHLHLLEAVPSGYWGAGASSPTGTVLDTNWIQFGPTLGDYPENAFWLMNPLVGVPEATAPAPLEASVPWPNPASGAVRLRVNGGTADQDRVEVFDLRGRRVRAITLSRGGEGIVQWDGCLRGGRRAPAGVYWLRVMNGGESVGRRVIINGR